MAGKRVKKEYRARLLPACVLLAAVCLLLCGERADAEVPQLPQRPALVLPQPQPEIRPYADPDAPPREQPPFAPVAESGPVTDDYFAKTAFLGDSRTEGFYLYSGLRQGSYYYAVGATVESAVSYRAEQWDMPLVDAMAAEEFDRIYIMLGINELGWKGTSLFYERYERLIDRLRADHPDAAIVLQPVLPVSAVQEAKDTHVNNTRIAEYNRVIWLLAEKKGCAYLELTEALADEEGFLRKEWTSDGVHLNIAGCKVWLDYLKSHPVM